MIHLKRKPQGIDIPIQQLQTKLFNKLVDVWGIDSSEYASYGRCYRNQTPNGYLPEIFIGENEGYKDLFLDDTYSAMSFFGTERIDNSDGNRRSDVHLIFAVNLKKLKPKIKHRADEEAHQDVLSIFGNRDDISFNSLIVGIENVFREYTAWRDKDKGINYRDMQPYHFFRINFTLRYIQQQYC